MVERYKMFLEGKMMKMNISKVLSGLCLTTILGLNTVLAANALTIDAGTMGLSSMSSGDTYYFDLSSIEGDLYQISNDVADTTLSYVPFTYVGEIEAYNLKNKSESKEDGIISERILFVADYNVGILNSWTELEENGLIFGTELQNGLTIRAMSGGSYDSTAGEDEWSTIIALDESYIMNWENIYSWCQDNSLSSMTTYKTVRGFGSIDEAEMVDVNNGNSQLGYRPVVQIDSDVKDSDIHMAVIDFNGGSAADGEKSIAICFVGNTYTAPSATSLVRANTEKSDSDYFAWNTKADGSGVSYSEGQAVSAEVTKLYAQWVENDDATDAERPDAEGPDSEGSNQGGSNEDELGTNTNPDVAMKPTGDSVDTGDHTGFTGWMILMILALTGVGVTLVYRKKKVEGVE